MSALSQNLTFQVTNGNTTTSSVQVVHPINTSSSLTIFSEPIKGNGYFNVGGGLHTGFWKITGFKGNISIEATLASNPENLDWFTVKLINIGSSYSADTSGIYNIDTTGLVVTPTDEYTTATTTSKSFNFVGNFVWIRGKISNWTQGTVNIISINR
jgi:hypothetical protein